MPLLTLPKAIQIGAQFEYLGHLRDKELLRGGPAWTIAGISLEHHEVRIEREILGQYTSQYLSISELLTKWRPVKR